MKSKYNVDSSYMDSIDLSEEEKLIFEKISVEDCSIDKLAIDSEMEIGELMVVLTNLEMNNLIKQAEGDKYTAI